MQPRQGFNLNNSGCNPETHSISINNATPQELNVNKKIKSNHEYLSW